MGVPDPKPGSAASGIRENREPDFDEIHRALVFEDTQPASEVVRRRVRELREQKDLRQKDLASAVTALGIPLTVSKRSRISNGVSGVSRSTSYSRLRTYWMFRLRGCSAPSTGRPIRAGGNGLERHEVVNSLVWGPPKSRGATRARRRMRLVSEIATMMQVSADEQDPGRRQEHRGTVACLVEDFWRAWGIRPGVTERPRFTSRADRGATQVAVSSMIHSPPTSRRRSFPQLGQRRVVASRSTSPGALIVDSTRAPQSGQASWLTSSLVLTAFAT